MIVCKGCNELKSHYAFGLCRKCYDKKQHRKYYVNNRKKILKQCTNYQKTHRKEKKKYQADYYKIHKDERKEYEKKRYVKNRKRLLKYRANYLKTPKGKLVDAKNKAKRKRELGFIPIDVIPLHVWEYVGIKKIAYHHINDGLVTAIPRIIHIKRIGGQHKMKIENWFLSLGIDIPQLRTIRWARIGVR